MRKLRENNKKGENGGKDTYLDVNLKIVEVRKDIWYYNNSWIEKGVGIGLTEG